MSRFPDFIIVGPMKTGSTVLWHNLNNHPQIKMCNNPADPKKTSTEIRFWTKGTPYVKDWDVDEYKALFKAPQDILTGEKCANYCESPATIRKIMQAAPKTKIIFAVRNPVERAYSHYFMQKTSSGHNKPFEQMIARYAPFSFYYNLLTNCVLPFVPQDQLYIFVTERMKNNTNEELNKIYEWLGLNRHDLITDVVDAKDRDVFIDTYKSWSTQYDGVKDKTRKQLTHVFGADTEKLKQFLNDDLAEWK